MLTEIQKDIRTMYVYSVLLAAVTVSFLLTTKQLVFNRTVSLREDSNNPVPV